MKNAFTNWLTVICSIVILNSCKKERCCSLTEASYNIDPTLLSLHYDETHKFTINKNGIALLNPDAVYSSSDTTVGVADADGVFRARKVGSTTVTITGTNYKLFCTVNVIPYSTLFVEPLLIPADSNAVKAYEKRKLASRLFNYPTPSFFVFTFAGENSKVQSLTYTFEQGKSIGVSVSFPPNVDINEVLKFIDERYTFYFSPREGFRLYRNNSTVNITVQYDRYLNSFGLLYTF